MDLPVMPPVAPMLARLSADIPLGAYGYEPKWDGFRAIVFRDRDEVEIGSRNGRSMSRYFPEVLAAIKTGLPERCVMDGEIVVPDASRGRLDFEALQQRIHPADSRVKLLAHRTPAHYVAFDLLAMGDRDLTGEPFRERRRVLEEVLASARAPIHLTPATRDPELAGRWFHEFEGAGLDGVVAKPVDVTYQPDRRVMVKVKHVRTADCVVAGYRTYKTDSRAVGSLLLGLYDDDGDLVFVGVVGAFTTARRRRALFEELQPLVVTSDGHPWDGGQAGARRTPQSSEVSRWSAGKDMSLGRLRPGAQSRSATTTWRGPPSHHPVRALAIRPGPAFMHLRSARGAGRVRPLRSPEVRRPPVGRFPASEAGGDEVLPPRPIGLSSEGPLEERCPRRFHQGEQGKDVAHVRRQEGFVAHSGTSVLGFSSNVPGNRPRIGRCRIPRGLPGTEVCASPLRQVRAASSSARSFVVVFQLRIVMDR